MIARRSVWCALALALVPGTLANDVTRHEAAFPGRLVDWTVDRDGDDPVLLVLVEPREPEEVAAEDDPSRARGDGPDESVPTPFPPCEDEQPRTPLSLYRWAVSGGREPVAIRDDLPHDGRQVGRFDLDRDGTAETVLDTPRGRVRLGAAAGGDRVVLARSWIAGLDDARVTVTGPGRLTVFEPGEDGGYRELGWTRLRVDATVGRWRTRIRTPAVTALGATTDGDRLLVTPAVAVGNRRVRTDLIRIPEDGPIAVDECWARLPEAEDLLDRDVVLFDGVPLLVTTTKEAGKLGLLTEKRLRVHALRPDRSRLGIEPLLAVESRMNLWQEPRFSATDVDGDGRADLAVAYWKGLKDSRVVIDVYLRNDDGSFRDKARSTAFDVEDGDRSWLRYGDDLDGDGRPDLVIRSGGAIHVHRGVPSPKGAKVVDREPLEVAIDADDLTGDAVVTVTVGSGGGGVGTWSRDAGPTIVDVGGGPAMVVRATRDGRDVLQVVRVRPGGD